MSRITFLDNASGGKNNWWRYLSTIILTWGGGKIFAIMLPIFMSAVFYLMLNGFNSSSQINSVISNPLFILLKIGIGEIILFLIFYICIRFIHKRKLISLVNTRSTISWSRILKGAVIWFTILVFVGILSLMSPHSGAKVTFNPNTFVILLILSLIIFPIPASFEELFFRGYLMQGLGLLTKKPVIPLLITSLVFAIPHYFNIYYINGVSTLIGIDWAVQAFIIGMALGIIVLGENRLETAIGVHTINNLFGTVVIYNTSTGLFGNLPAIITVTSQGTPNIIGGALMSVLFLLVLLTVVFWNKWEKMYNIFKTERNDTLF